MNLTDKVVLPAQKIEDRFVESTDISFNEYDRKWIISPNDGNRCQCKMASPDAKELLPATYPKEMVAKVKVGNEDVDKPHKFVGGT